MAHAVAVFVKSPEGIPLVLDVRKPLPHFWKFPGGKGEGAETIEETACRELYEETGILVPPKEMADVYEEERKGHTFHFVCAEAKNLTGLITIGDEGEEVKVFSLEEFKALQIFPPHKKIFDELLTEGLIKV